MRIRPAVELNMWVLAFEAVPSNRGLKTEQLAYVCILDSPGVWQPSHDDGKTHVQWLLLRSVKCHGRAQKYSGAIAVVGDGPEPLYVKLWAGDP
jgi:hypothetical protein